MRRNPRALVEDLASLRGQIDQLMFSISSLFLSGETPPDSPPPLIRFRAVVEPLIQSPAQPGGTAPGSKPKGPQLRSDSFKNLNAWEACEKFLLFRGKPARTAEIAVALEAHGFETTSKNTRGFLFQVLRKKPTVFTRPDKGTWGLKAWERE